MSASKEERDRILHLVETGQITAFQAAQLLDALEEQANERARGPGRERVLRVRTANFARGQKATFTATLPVGLIKASLRLGAHVLPQLSTGALEDLVRAIDNGATGRLLDLNDFESGERLEIFVE